MMNFCDDINCFIAENNEFHAKPIPVFFHSTRGKLEISVHTSEPSLVFIDFYHTKHRLIFELLKKALLNGFSMSELRRGTVNNLLVRSTFEF